MGLFAVALRTEGEELPEPAEAVTRAFPAEDRADEEFGLVLAEDERLARELADVMRAGRAGRSRARIGRRRRRSSSGPRRFPTASAGWTTRASKGSDTPGHRSCGAPPSPHHGSGGRRRPPRSAERGGGATTLGHDAPRSSAPAADPTHPRRMASWSPAIASSASDPIRPTASCSSPAPYSQCRGRDSASDTRWAT